MRQVLAVSLCVLWFSESSMAGGRFGGRFAPAGANRPSGIGNRGAGGGLNAGAATNPVRSITPIQQPSAGTSVGNRTDNAARLKNPPTVNRNTATQGTQGSRIQQLQSQLGAPPQNGRMSRQQFQQKLQQMKQDGAPTKEQVQQKIQSKMSPTQQANVDKLKSDMQAMKDGSNVTQEQKDALKNSLSDMLSGATKPSQESVQTLANDLSTSMADGSLSLKEKATLTSDFQSVLDSANITADEFGAFVASAQDVLTASGVSKDDVATIAGDLKAIGSEVKANAGSTGN